jgi:hypothetical protein
MSVIATGSSTSRGYGLRVVAGTTVADASQDSSRPAEKRGGRVLVAIEVRTAALLGESVERSSADCGMGTNAACRPNF